MTTYAGNTIGGRLKGARLISEMSLEEAAAAIGVQPEMISDYELGAQDPGANTLVALAELYGAPAGELLTGRDYIVREDFSGQEVAIAALSASPALVLLENGEVVSDEALSYVWECIEFAMARDKKRREIDEGVRQSP